MTISIYFVNEWKRFAERRTIIFLKTEMPKLIYILFRWQIRITIFNFTIAITDKIKWKIDEEKNMFLWTFHTDNPKFNMDFMHNIEVGEGDGHYDEILEQEIAYYITRSR
jgi:hypothetical protein